MPIYVSLVNFTHEGLKTMKDKGVARSDMVKQNVESLGGKLLNAYYCLGEYDVVASSESFDPYTDEAVEVKSGVSVNIDIEL